MMINLSFNIIYPFGPIITFPCVLHSEENVWQLCDTIRRQRPGELNRCYVVFISNEAKCVPLWRQRAGKTDDKLVTWVSI